MDNESQIGESRPRKPRSDELPAPVLVVGFMGSRQGLTEPQKQTLRELLRHLAPSEAHHGDCVGADAEFHDLVKEFAPGATIVIHPPTRDEFRAHKSAHHWQHPQDYLTRDQAIVSRCDLLIAAPGTFQAVQPSGTWETVDFARAVNKRTLLILPDGDSSDDGGCVGDGTSSGSASA